MASKYIKSYSYINYTPICISLFYTPPSISIIIYKLNEYLGTILFYILASFYHYISIKKTRGKFSLPPLFIINIPILTIPTLPHQLDRKWLNMLLEKSSSFLYCFGRIQEDDSPTPLQHTSFIRM